MSRVRWSLAGVACLAVLVTACPPPPAPVTMPSDNLGDTTVGVAYSHTITATGGTGALTYSATGLPAGLSINSGSGTISGTSTAAGDFTVQVTATDTKGVSASQGYPLKVYDAPVMNATVPATANVGAPVSGLLQATGGKAPIAFGVASGQLPPGVTVASSTGVVSGTPSVAGTFTASLSATDANGAVASQSVTIAVLAGAPPSVVTTTLPNGVVGSPYLQTLAAQNGQPPYAWSVSSGSLPAGLSLSASGQIGGTPTATGNSTFQVTVTDANNQTARGNLAIAVFTPLQIGTSSLPDGYATTAYAATTLAASGGQAPYTWSTSSTLPAGLAFNASTATLSGTPAAASPGSYSLTFTVTDGSGQTRSAVLTLDIYALPQITTASLADGGVGVSYVQALQASGGKAPFSWTITTGALPAGIVLDSPTATLLGTPTAAGTSTFVLQVTDANGRTGSKVFTLAIYAGLTITYGPAPDGYTGQGYSQTLTAAGGRTPFSWVVVAGSLPAGLTLSGAGSLSGTPSAAGTSGFTVQVTDANSQTATKALSITIYAPPSITNPSLPDGYVTTAYSAQLNATGGKTPYTFSVAAGALPAGLSLAGNGSITGTPTAAGPATFTAQVADANGRTATAALTINVYAQPSVSTSSLPDAYQGSAYSSSVIGAGGKTPYTFSVTAGSLPTGLSLSSSGALTGIPGGAPGTSSFTVTLTDANGVTASRALSIEVLGSLQVTTASMADGYTGSAYSQVLAATGGRPPYRWSSDTLPAGLSLNLTTGAVTGTPSAAGTTTVTFTVSDANNATGSRPLAIAIYAPPSLPPATLPDAYPAISYSATVTGTGGKAPYAFTAGAGLPAGLVMLSSGAITGNTTASPGTFTFTATMTDANGVTATQSFSIIVRADLAISPAALAEGYATEAYSQSVTGSGGRTPYAWSVASGALPAGVTLDAVSGAIGGTPSAAGTSAVTIRLTDANSATATRPYSIQIYQLPVITTASLPIAVVGAPYNQAIAFTGGKAPFTWAQTGTLPPGITFNTSTGTFSGTAPATPGTYPNIAVTLTDANGRNNSRTYTLTVGTPPTIITTSINDAYVGAGFSQVLDASGGTGTGYTYSVTAGALPAGLTLFSSGLYSGSPTGPVGTASFTVTVTDSGGNTGSRAFTQAVYTLPTIPPTPLSDGYAGLPYNQPLTVTGGKAPFNWFLVGGVLPAGLTLSPTGTLGPQIALGATVGPASFNVAVSDANGMIGMAPMMMVVYRVPSITNASLATATEGVTYLRAPGAPEQLTAVDGKAPLTFSAGAGLPGGITLAGNGTFSGIPAQGTAGPHPVNFTVTDVNGRSGSVTLDLQVNAAQPIYGGGTNGVAPGGSPITDVLTVFVQDSAGHPYGDKAVRLRRNGVEFAPVKQQVADATGKTVFTGLGLNGTTGTVDITVSGANIVNTSWQKVNASLVTIPVLSYPMPMPRAYANGAIDPPSGKLLVTFGVNPNWTGNPFVTGLFNTCQKDVIRLTDSAAGTWVEDLPPGMVAMPDHWSSGMAYSAAVGAHVLFGGQDCGTGVMLNEVWQYNAGTATWTQRTPSGAVPGPRMRMAMATLSSGQIAVFGGTTEQFSGLSDLYLYDAASAVWTQRTPAPAPPPRFDAASTAVGNTLWVCGGSDQAIQLSDCWSYDSTANAWASRPAIPGGPRQLASMAATPGGQVYLFGGEAGGVARNDLLVSSGGAWTAPIQTNPPPVRSAAVLVHEPATGNLLLFGGQDPLTGQIYGDLWSYSPATGAWTQRTPTFTPPASSGFTISGSISNGALGNLSRVVLEISGLSGYINRQTIALTNGSASYVMAGIPPGDTVTLTALNENRALPYPNREWSWIDLGVVATNISGNMTVNVTMPTGPVTPLASSTLQFTLPAGYLGEAFVSLLPRLTRPGYANHPNGGTQYLGGNTVRADYFPPSPGASQTLIPNVASAIAQACEQSTVWLYNATPGAQPAITFPPGPRSLTPGLNGCIPAGTGLQFQTNVGGNQPALGGVAAADVSRDGAGDLVMVSGTELGVYFGVSTGDGFFNFSPDVTIPLPSNGAGVVVADFNGDTWLDMAVGLPATNEVMLVLQATGGGTFFTTSLGTAGVSPAFLSAGDFSGDGVVDLVYAGGPLVGWMRGRGDSTFDPPGSLPTVASVTALSPIATLDADTRGDVACGQQDNRIRFFRGTATGLQAVAGSMVTPGRPVSIATGDLDGDGIQDLAAAMDLPGTFQTLRGTGGFTYGLVTNLLLASSPTRVAMAELTGDSLKDVVLALSDFQFIELGGTGGGAVSQIFSGFTAMVPFELAIGDVNTDGNPDVMVGSGTGGQLPQVDVYLVRRSIPAGTDALSFVAPATTRVYGVDRGAWPYAFDYQIISRAVAGTNTVSFPLTSTLRPSRPAPAGQHVFWAPSTYLANDPANLSIDNFRPNRLRLDGQGFVWDYWKYRR